METQQKFIRIVSQAEIAISGKLELDLDVLRNQFGNDFNTLQITNTDPATAINLYLDGQKVSFITGNNGNFSFDWELGLNYNFITLENTSGAVVIGADKIKVFVGRTGINV